MATRIEQINTNLLDPRQYLAKDVKVVGEYPVTSKFDPNTDTVEFYIYDINRNIISYTPEFTQYKVIDPSISETLFISSFLRKNNAATTPSADEKISNTS